MRVAAASALVNAGRTSNWSLSILRHSQAEVGQYCGSWSASATAASAWTLTTLILSAEGICGLLAALQLAELRPACTRQDKAPEREQDPIAVCGVCTLRPEVLLKLKELVLALVQAGIQLIKSGRLLL